MNPSRIIARALVITFAILCCTVIEATAAETRIETLLADNGTAVIVFAESPLKTMTEIPFSIELNKSNDEVINNAKLAIDLTMPFMPMPPNKPSAVWQDNAYRGTAIFTMAGAWQVNVEINRPEAEPEKITFDIEMVVMK